MGNLLLMMIKKVPPIGIRSFVTGLAHNFVLNTDEEKSLSKDKLRLIHRRISNRIYVAAIELFLNMQRHLLRPDFLRSVTKPFTKSSNVRLFILKAIVESNIDYPPVRMNQIINTSRQLTGLNIIH